MCNDNRIMETMIFMSMGIDHWLSQVREQGNQNAYTDRMLEDVIKDGESLKYLYNSNTVK